MSYSQTRHMDLFDSNFTIDLSRLSWSIARESSGTAGSFFKSFEVQNRVKIYYKLSYYDTRLGNIGHESVNEIIAMNIGKLLGFEMLDYELVHAVVNINGRKDIVWLTKSKDFKYNGERKLSIEDYYEINRLDREDKLDFLIRQHLDEWYYQILILDYIIFNRDRHGANSEILVKKDGSFRHAPIFDNGVSLLFSTYGNEEKIKEYDNTKSGPANNWLGSFDVFENLLLIPDSYIKTLDFKKINNTTILQGVNGSISSFLKQSICDMVMSRINRLEEIYDL